MAVEPRRLLTYTDLQTIREDDLRRELIDGDLLVTAGLTLTVDEVLGAPEEGRS